MFFPSLSFTFKLCFWCFFSINKFIHIFIIISVSLFLYGFVIYLERLSQFQTYDKYRYIYIITFWLHFFLFYNQ